MPNGRQRGPCWSTATAGTDPTMPTRPMSPRPAAVRFATTRRLKAKFNHLAELLF